MAAVPPTPLPPSHGLTFFAGDAADNFFVGGEGQDVISGAGGNDLLVGNGGNDQLGGGAGADLVNGGLGDDALDGGPGSDLLNYLRSAGPITVDLASRRASGEGTDTVRGFETVAGSHSADVLRGDAGANTLQGKGGNDRLEGRGGNDFLDGGGETDRVAGGPGRDYCFDGERFAGCETRERSRAQPLVRVLTSLSFTSQRMREAPAQGAVEAPRPTIAERLASLLGNALPLDGESTASAAASPRDTVTYVPIPQCRPRGRGAVTSISPPKGVQPMSAVGGQQTARWRGLLTRGNRVVYRTPVVEAVIAGPHVATLSGWPAEWREVGTRRPYRPVPRSLSGGRHRWKGELSILESGRAATRHDVVPPGSCPGR